MTNFAPILSLFTDPCKEGRAAGRWSDWGGVSKAKERLSSLSLEPK